MLLYVLYSRILCVCVGTGGRVRECEKKKKSTQKKADAIQEQREEVPKEWMGNNIYIPSEPGVQQGRREYYRWPLAHVSSSIQF